MFNDIRDLERSETAIPAREADDSNGLTMNDLN